MGNSSKEDRGYTKTNLNSALRLPDPEKEFQLYVHEIEGIALGVLTQSLGPVAYLCMLSRRGRGEFGCHGEKKTDIRSPPDQGSWLFPKMSK